MLLLCTLRDVISSSYTLPLDIGAQYSAMQIDVAVYIAQCKIVTFYIAS